jgi:hypothetical protein
MMYGRFVLSHLASQFLRLRAVDPLGVEALTFLPRYRARKGELARTVSYCTDVVCFVYDSKLESRGGGRNSSYDTEDCVLGYDVMYFANLGYLTTKYIPLIRVFHRARHVQTGTLWLEFAS